MKPVLLARFNGCIYTRIVYPDFIIHNIGSEPIIALFHDVDVGPGDHNKQIVFVIPSDIVKSHVGTWYVIDRPQAYVQIAMTDLIHRVTRACDDRCINIKFEWTILASNYIDVLLWRLLEAVNDELFFEGVAEKKNYRRPIVCH